MTGEPPPAPRSPEPFTLSALLQALARDTAPSSLARVPPGPGEKVGRFEVVRELGRGGFGVVLEARDPLLHRRVALKLVRPGRRVDAGGPELAEAAAVAQLAHPNIVDLHDAGVSDAGPFLVFEKLEGEPLSSRLERGPMPVAEAARMVLEVAKGLAHAHRNAVVHRDLKPSNVFLCADGRVKVLDFGLARIFGRRRTIEGGTPGWMAPEQRRGAPEDERTDVWALGAILFRALAGRDPAEHRLTIEEEPQLMALLERMLEHDPVKRPRDATEVVQALEPIVRTIEARQGRATIRVRRRVPRTVRRAAAALSILAAAAVFAWRFVPGPRSLAPARPPLVAVADFTNETGDPDLDGLGGLVGTALQESPGLRVLTRSRMRDLQRTIGDEGGDRIDESTGREIAKRAGVGGLLVGSVSRMGELVLVELRAIDPQRDEYLFTHREQARGKSEVLALVDRLAVRARQQFLGDRGPSTYSAPIARLVTPNLEAYRHYATGRSLEERNLPGAQDAYREAIELDPEFALAHFALVTAASREKAPIGELGAIATAAIQVADRAPWREARLIRAWNAIVERRVADARALFKEVLERHPDDKEALALYASVAASPEEALAYLERALLADPMYVPAQEQMVGALRDLGREAELLPLARTWLAQPPAPRRLGAAALALAAAGDLDGALEAAKREDLLSPGRSTLEAIHLARGEYVEAERVARERIERSGKGIGWLAVSLTYQGRRREALAVLEEASRGGSLAAYAALGIAAADGPTERLRARARALVAAQPSLDWLAALALALAGDVPEAERYAGALSRDQADPGSTVFPDEVLSVATFVRAVAARARGDPATGRAMLRDLVASRRFKARLVCAFALGQACAEDGDLGCAVAALRQYRTDHSPVVLFQNWMFPRSALLLAEVLERQGQVDEARGLVQRFLSDWRNADRDLPELARARALCTRVRCHPAPPARDSLRQGRDPAGLGREN
ncbi:MULTISPECIES: protein kinase [unclassified Anaeromyxobacter]|uniref:serine/threonine-protein kinase n=1 Tax=unclassified Anaeromyxobacter TaxID=2620896 RepID=UPI001F55CD9E|nr:MULTISPECIES: serine/threonine-protein kinase [unclassified Anaeromyxobacter]